MLTVAADANLRTLRIVVPAPNGQQQEIQIPLNIGSGVAEVVVDAKNPRARVRARRKPYNTNKSETKKLLKTRFVQTSAMPLWLADLGCRFNPDDEDFFAKEVKPVLEKRMGDRKVESLKRLKNQVRALRFFLLKNYPSIVHGDVHQLLSRYSDGAPASTDLTSEEKRSLENIELCVKRPEELTKLHRQAQKQVKALKERGKKTVNRVLIEFAHGSILKKSITNINVS
jgi:hypothetical protein